MSTRNALLAVAAGTVAGIIGTIAAGSEPGGLLGFFITVGALVGVLGVRRGAVYLFFPLSPFAFFIGAVITGKIHDSSISSTTTGLAATLLQWIADIFFPMCVATILVLLVGGIRWVLGLMVVGGHFPMPDGRQAGPRNPRPRTAPGPRTDIDPWADPNARVRRAVADDPRADSQPAPRPGRTPRPGPDGGRPLSSPRPAAPPRPGADPRQPRDPRDDRDPWGDPRPGPPADRRPSARSAPPAAPQAAPQPTFRPRPAKSASPGDRAPRPPAPPRPVRPPGDSRDQGY
jgi:hypothetical protein